MATEFSYDNRGGENYAYGFVYKGEERYRAAYTYDHRSGELTLHEDATGGWKRIPSNQIGDALAYLRKEFEQ
jgi:hypothetical protein